MIKRLFFVWSLFLAIGTLTSCSEEEPEVIDDGSGNTSDIAVTSLVDEYGITYATISGYVNLNLLTSSGDTPGIGVELDIIKMTDEGEKAQSFGSQTTKELVGRKFVVDFTGLSGGSKFQYRTFVKSGGMTYYGEYRTLTTKDFTNLTSTGDATDITFTSVNITSSVNKKFINEKESLGIGIAYSLEKTKLHPDSTFSVKSFPINELRGDTYTIGLNKLLTGKTYYYASYTKAGGTYKLGSIKSFTTKSLQGHLTTGDASDITFSSATIKGTSTISSLYPQGTSVTYGIRYATSEDNLGIAEIPDGFILYDQYSGYDYYYNPQTGETIKVYRNYKTVIASVTDENANNITVQLKNLKANQTYYYCVYAKVDGTEFTGEVKNFTTRSLDGYLTIDDATDITFTSATLRGTSSLSTLYDNSSTSIYYYFKYATSSNYYDYETISPTLSSDSIAATLHNLYEGQKYYYCLCANVDGITLQTESKEFNTESSAKYLATGDANDITLTSAKIKGETKLSDIYSSTVPIDYYVYYATSDDKLYNSSYRKKENAARNNNELTATISSLSPNTTYYYMVVAYADNRYIYGEIKSFSTKTGSDYLATGTATNITMTSADISGTSTLSEIYSDQSFVQYKVFYGTTTDNLESNISMTDNNGKLSVSLSNLTIATTYCYCIGAIVNGITIKGEVKSFTTNDLQATGYVDLGVSCKWATCNLGASSPESAGKYYGWGDVEDRTFYYSSNNSHYGEDIGNDISGTKYDVARMVLGNPWRMPTKSEFQELLDKCYWKEITYKNQKGYLVIGKNGNVIFFPKVGCKYDNSSGSGYAYWTSTKDKYGNGDSSYYPNHDAWVWEGTYIDDLPRYYGCTIRPVQ